MIFRVQKHQMEKERKQLLFHQDRLEKSEKILENNLSELQMKYNELMSVRVSNIDFFYFIDHFSLFFSTESARRTEQRT